ncbi:hypothetical protein [Saccharibacillus brassicae]|uniref:hypothetical protein n=1 Tax=Saccharibacillus brassicae TaxID=2583377 RepID=UPI001BAEB843
MAGDFEKIYATWLAMQIEGEKGFRRRELLQKGPGHGTIEFLRHIWFPTVGHLDDLHAEWEVRDDHGGYRYVDLAYRRGGAKRRDGKAAKLSGTEF